MDNIDASLARIATLRQTVFDRNGGVKTAREALFKAEDELAEATAALYMVEVVNSIAYEQLQTAKIVALSEHVRRGIGPFRIRLDPPRHVAVYLKHTDDLLGRQFRIFWPVGQELNFTVRDDDEERSEGREHRACLFRTLEEAQAFRDRVMGRK